MAPNKPVYTPFVVELPILKFRNITPIEPLEKTIATTPSGAVTNILSRGFNPGKENRRQRNVAVGNAVSRLERERGLDIERYAFEVADVVYDQDGKRLKPFQRDHEDSRLYFMAQELTKLHGLNPIDNLGVARKVLEFYDSQR